MLGMARLGIELIRRGRFSLRPERVRDPQRIREIMEYPENGNEKEARAQ
jgi:hypothetical protein